MITARGIQTVHCLCLFFFFLTATVAYPKLRMQCLFFVFFFFLSRFFSLCAAREKGTLSRQRSRAAPHIQEGTGDANGHALWSPDAFATAYIALPAEVLFLARSPCSLSVSARSTSFWACSTGNPPPLPPLYHGWRRRGTKGPTPSAARRSARPGVGRDSR